MTAHAPAALGLAGWATDPERRHDLFTYLPLRYDDPEPPFTLADAFEPPHPLAVPADLCDRLLAAAEVAPPGMSPNGQYRQLDLDPDDERDIVARFRQVNDAWWRLELDEFNVHAKRYRPGDSHARHQDTHAGAARRKLAGSVQLSHPDAYEGGDLLVHHSVQTVAVPRTRGTLIALPGWTVHEVEAVTSGERWALIINAWGPPLK